MCGITGIVAFNESGANYLDKVESAVKTLAQRGPDSNGTYKHNNVALGHTRLSIIDTSDAASQPFTDTSGRYTIIYNGEFYNYKEHRKILESKGVQFRSKSDTEVLLYLYIHEGPACLAKVNGFFAFAIYDKQEETLFIARDRMGIKPLLVYQDDDKFIFASEMKALMAFGTPKEIDNVSLFTYLQLNYIPAPHSIFKNVKKLDAGSYLIIHQASNIQHQTYYSIPYSPDEIAQVNLSSYESAQKTLIKLLENAVQNRLVADVPLGTFLSGGIDSSIITALAAQNTDNLNTFSIGYKDEPYFDETHYSQLVAKKYNTNHTVFSLTNNDLFEHLYNILDYIDEPFADSSAIAVNILSYYTKQHVTVALSGDGADEMFSGYNKHLAEFKARDPGIVEQLVKGITPMFDKLPQSRNTKFGNLSRQLSRFGKGAKLANKERYWSWASIIDEEEANYYLKESKGIKFQRLSDDAYEYKKRKENLLKHIRKNGDINDVLYTDMHLVLQNDMLAKVDLMSMANGLEVRTPFLDHNVVNFAFTLPSLFKINASIKKKILQDTFKSWLPAELYNRPKQGFEVPLLKWFRTELKSMITDELLDDDFIKEQDIFNTDAVKNLKSKLFSKNPGDAQATIWALIVFQYWWKKYFV